VDDKDLLRDLFAMAVVAGLYASDKKMSVSDISEYAYLQAESMMRERQKGSDVNQ
jgi:hypothetical protein